MASKNWLSSVQNKTKPRPNVIVVHGVEGSGKTSFAAQAPGNVFLMSPGETGLLTLMNSGQVGDVPHFPEITAWPDLLDVLEAIETGDHKYRALTIDVANGLETLCHDLIVDREFGGDRTKATAFGGHHLAEAAVAEWRRMLAKLDAIRNTRGMSIVLLVHTKVANFKNPEGPDYDRYVPDLHRVTWSATHKFADVVGFINFSTTVVTAKKDEAKGKGKAKGGSHRLMHFNRTAAYDAKNRVGLPDEIDLGRSPAEGWAAFLSAIKEARANGMQTT